jgi:hypothetical protein
MRVFKDSIPDLDNSTAVHNGYLIGNHLHRPKVMADDDETDTGPGSKLEH